MNGLNRFLRIWKCFHLCDFLADGTHFSPTSSENGKFKYITSKNIKEYGFDFSNLTYINQTSHSKIYNRCPVKYGDILYIKDGATAGVAMINNLKEEFYLLSSVALIIPNPRIVIIPNLKKYLNFKMIKNNILTKCVNKINTRTYS
ncbi:hypothetical protein E0494_10125 [Marinilabiliaceae bacterium JC040]|nr:hypothetical protein [Marinilabiliaceae bacterium JC040]